MRYTAVVEWHEDDEGQARSGNRSPDLMYINSLTIRHIETEINIEEERSLDLEPRQPWV